jgi:hypothetical protein
VQDSQHARGARRAKRLILVAVLVVVDSVIALFVFAQYRAPEHSAPMAYKTWYFGESHGRAAAPLGPAIVATVVCVLVLVAAEACLLWLLSSSRLLSGGRRNPS